jgi:hypothetical protein
VSVKQRLQEDDDDDDDDDINDLFSKDIAQYVWPRLFGNPLLFDNEIG